MPSDGTVGGLVGKLDVLHIEWPTCGRQGRYQVARLLEVLGPGTRLTDWLNARTADWPQKDAAGPTRACGVVCRIWSICRKRLRDRAVLGSYMVLSRHTE